MSGPANAGLAIIIFVVIPVVLLFVLAFCGTKGRPRVVVWCVLTALLTMIFTYVSLAFLWLPHLIKA